MIRFACQICKEEILVPDSLVGQFEACPTCRTLVPVPGPYKPAVPAGWYSDRVASAHAERVRQAQSSARKLIWGFSLAALGFAIIGMVIAVYAAAHASAVLALWFTTICTGLCAVIAFAAIPGAVARSRGLTNADGINTLGILGVFIPIVWLVALVMALVCTPPASRGHP